MGVFLVRVNVFKIGAEDRVREIELTVDTGATYPVIPIAVADELRLEAAETRTFTLADGRRIPRRLAWAGLAVNGRKTPSLVVLGEGDDAPLLGAFALEGLGLEVDPIAKSLRPATQYLL